MKQFQIEDNRYWYLILIVIICLFISWYQKYILTEYSALPEIEYSIYSNGFREMNFGKDTLYDVMNHAEELSVDPYELITVIMLDNKYDAENADVYSYTRSYFSSFRNKLVRHYPNQFTELKSAYKKVLSGLYYFPVPMSGENREWVDYVDSWGYTRTYGGERRHEGTDIMALENIRDIYPILSVSDGVVTNIGWLEQGGYRIGITSESGAYFYYAHMASYAPNIEKGAVIHKGQILGYMGDTGYSTVEGTTGKFDVHLHFGIYLNEGENEISVNPYWILKYLENKILYYSY